MSRGQLGAENILSQDMPNTSTVSEALKGDSAVQLDHSTRHADFLRWHEAIFSDFAVQREDSR